MQSLAMVISTISTVMKTEPAEESQDQEVHQRSFAEVPLKGQRADAESDVETESTAGTDAAAAETESSTGSDSDCCSTDDEHSDELIGDEEGDAPLGVGVRGAVFRHRCPPGLCPPGLCGCFEHESECELCAPKADATWDVVGSRMSVVFRDLESDDEDVMWTAPPGLAPAPEQARWDVAASRMSAVFGDLESDDEDTAEHTAKGLTPSHKADATWDVVGSRMSAIFQDLESDDEDLAPAPKADATWDVVGSRMSVVFRDLESDDEDGL